MAACIGLLQCSWMNETQMILLSWSENLPTIKRKDSLRLAVTKKEFETSIGQRCPASNREIDSTYQYDGDCSSCHYNEDAIPHADINVKYVHYLFINNAPFHALTPSPSLKATHDDHSSHSSELHSCQIHHSVSPA